jgi:predicted subunit of tRNA(5-methylaminomethyl-2-thiouridylate) methyltransferase
MAKRAAATLSPIPGILFKSNGTRKEDGIPLVGIKVLREREKRLLLDFIRDNLKQPKKRRKE